MAELRLSLAACDEHRDLVEQALKPDAPLSLMEEYVRVADDCPNCQKALEKERREAEADQSSIPDDFGGLG